MCGIGGIWRRDGRGAEHRDLRRMMSAIAHRGPEGAAFGRMDGGALLLGFLRLGFTGYGMCNQPLYSEDHGVALVYNGEIYDFEALREDLARRGHAFRTTSDSEVIVHLYEEHGERFFEHLNGEFAFAIWDARREELVLVRDRYGVKPLFYAWHEGAFVFASEAKGILALDGFSAELDPVHFTGAGIGLSESTRTPFRGIRSVRPGHVMRVSRRGVREEPYWQPPFRAPGARETRSLEEAAAAVRRALTAAVRRRMEGNPPLGLSLSSGLDSTIVCGLAAEEARRAGRKLTAFTLGYDGADYDESAAAARTAAHHGVAFERVRATPEGLASRFLEAIHSIEVATNSLSATARIQMACAVRDSGLKALMSGEGADELFGGYPYFGLEAIWRGLGGSGEGRAAAERAWQAFREEEAPSRGIFWDDGDAWRREAPVFGFPSAYQLRAQRAQRAMRALFSRDFLRRMEGATPLGTMAGEFDVAALRALSPFDATRAIARGVLGSVIIPGLGDRVEMAGSLEGRVPYLDLEVIELACSLPEELCIDPRTFTRKRVLRRAFADMLPPGFAPPRKTTRMAPSFAELARTARGRELVGELLSPRAVARAGVFDPAFVLAARAAWRLLPERGRRHAQVDMMIGYVVCTQALHHVLVEDGLGKRASLGLLALDEDRSPPAERGRGGESRAGGGQGPAASVAV